MFEVTQLNCIFRTQQISSIIAPYCFVDIKKKKNSPLIRTFASLFSTFLFALERLSIRPWSPRLFVKHTVRSRVDSSWRKHDERVCNYKRARIFQIFDFDCNATMLLSCPRVRFLCDSNRIARRSTDRTQGPEDRSTEIRTIFFFPFFRFLLLPSSRPPEEGGGKSPEQKARAERGERYIALPPFKGEYRFDIEPCALLSLCKTNK